MPGLWSGSITFGLVSIPVRLEVSQRRRNLGFNLLHQDCLQRINQKYHCPSCETEVERTDLVKGYEYEKDRYTVVDPADFEAADGEASRHIEVVAFVDHSDLRAEHPNRTYYLVPEARTVPTTWYLKKEAKKATSCCYKPCRRWIELPWRASS